MHCRECNVNPSYTSRETYKPYWNVITVKFDREFAIKQWGILLIKNCIVFFDAPCTFPVFLDLVANFILLLFLTVKIICGVAEAEGLCNVVLCDDLLWDV